MNTEKPTNKMKRKKEKKKGSGISYPCRSDLCLGHQSPQSDLLYWDDLTSS